MKDLLERWPLVRAVLVLAGLAPALAVLHALGLLGAEGWGLAEGPLTLPLGSAVAWGAFGFCALGAGGAAAHGSNAGPSNLPKAARARDVARSSGRAGILAYVLTGLGGGLLAGLVLGVAEASLIVALARPPRDLSVLGWAAAVSSVFWALVGAGLGGGLGLVVRVFGRREAPAERRYAFVAASLICGFGFMVSWFRISRDVYREAVGMTTPVGLLTIGGLAIAFGLLFFLLRYGLRRLTAWRGGRFLLRPWGTPAAAGGVGLVLAALGLVGGVEVAHANGPSRPTDPGLPNVVLVMVDTVRADHLSVYGYREQTSPNLAALAEESVLFENAFAEASWTRPSVATLLTGRYPSSHGTMLKSDALPDEVETIAETLRGRGYHTAGIVTNFNLAPYFNFHQGYDEYDYLEPIRLLGAGDAAAKLVLYEVLRRVAARLPLPLRPEQFYREARFTTDRAIEWLGTRRPDAGPYFLFLTYMDPHDPYFRHPLDGTAVGAAFMPRPDPAMADEIRALYDGEIRYWDEHLGRLLQALRARPDWDRTLVIVCSDHGEEFHEHGGWYHGKTLYEEQIHVPLVVRLPGSELAGSRESRWVGLIDVAPTVARLAGARIPEQVQGLDLFAVEGGDRVMFAEEDHEGNRLRSVRFRDGDREWKFIEANEGNPRGLPTTELFDIAADRGETTNLVERESAAAAAAETRLREEAVRAAEGAVEASRIGLDPAAVERLRSLGYME